MSGRSESALSKKDKVFPLQSGKRFPFMPEGLGAERGITEPFLCFQCLAVEKGAAGELHAREITFTCVQEFALSHLRRCDFEILLPGGWWRQLEDERYGSGQSRLFPARTRGARALLHPNWIQQGWLGAD